jgi:hypothetical protein
MMRRALRRLTQAFASSPRLERSEEVTKMAENRPFFSFLPNALSYEQNLSRPVIRLWDDTRHFGN